LEKNSWKKIGDVLWHTNAMEFCFKEKKSVFFVTIFLLGKKKKKKQRIDESFFFDQVLGVLRNPRF